MKLFYHLCSAVIVLCAGFVILVSIANSQQPSVIDEEPANEATDPGEAPQGFDNRTNGFTSQAQFLKDKADFEEDSTIETGLGPVYNGTSCVACHQNPITGGNSQASEIRSGHFDGVKFVPSPGGSLIHHRAIDPAIQERVLAGENLRSTRTSTSVLGLGFAECVADQQLQALAASQPEEIRGSAVFVPLLEAKGKVRIGRFGWKCQQASLVSFSADAQVNEKGITTPLTPAENLSNGRSVDAFDRVSDPEDEGGVEGFGVDVEAYTRFQRSTKMPPRDRVVASSQEAVAGSALFDSVGCAGCHVRNMRTAEPGSTINGGVFTVPLALGGKTFHPFSDFLMHDIGTGDGIVINGPQSTANQFRTAPLVMLRLRTRMMHDGRSFTRQDAILQHGGQASATRARFLALTDGQKRSLIIFLQSL